MIQHKILLENSKYKLVKETDDILSRVMSWDNGITIKHKIIDKTKFYARGEEWVIKSFNKKEEAINFFKKL